jgi:uncharacterized membrane protein (UPF0127 family)
MGSPISMRGRVGLSLLVAFGLLFYVVLREHTTTAPATLPQMPLIIETATGPVRFTVEMATTRQQQERGLMFRESLAPDAGMLFDLVVEKAVSFWMKDTLIPLDMIFIKANGTIVRIAADAKPLSRDNVPSYEPVRAVLEIAGGRAAALGLKPGDRALHAIFGNAPR